MLKKELEKVTELINKFSEESNDGYKTIGLATIEYYLEELKHLYKSTIANFEPCSKKDRETFKILMTKSDQLKGDIIYQYMRNFSIFENNLICAKELSEIPATIEEVEKQFLSKVISALEYFGAFVQKEIHLGITASEKFEPHSIEEIIKFTQKNKTNWTLYTINSGCPQPLYKERFNILLKKGINAYIEAYIHGYLKS